MASIGNAFDALARSLAARSCLFSSRFLRFGLVGAIATGLYFFLGFFFVFMLGFSALLGNALAYALSFVVSYLGQRCWTFESADSHAAMLPRFAGAQAIGLGVNSAIVGVCLRLGISYGIAMIVASGIVPVMVYFICKYWVFRVVKN